MADAKEPVQDLEQNISRAISILNESRHSKDGSQEVQLQELQELLVKSFDFHEFSKRVLASHWKRFSAREQEVFIDVFSRFIGDFYLRKVLDLYSGEKVIFIEQAKVTDSKAVITIQVQRKGLKIPVKVKMLKRDGSWKVYDLVFLGISGVSNYRAQFRVLLKKQSPA
ncbi:MAG: ABC transporter substrate-binding protein, partial [Deltaproteobacteria bacterium]|nr:ABC transporter substrate-binding protein [Deltaproteobacteria bacterium]